MRSPSYKIRDSRLIAPNTDGISKAAISLKKGNLVAFPTETVYGLGANENQDEAVSKIFAAKSRPKCNPLIVHVFSAKLANDLAEFTPLAKKLAKTFWPGALTLILKKRSDCPISLLVSCGLDNIAIRVPSHPMALKLLIKSGIPIAAPSANKSGTVSPTKPGHVLKSWPKTATLGPEFVLDSGPCRIGIESTVVDVTTNKTSILRPGGITREQLENVIGPLPMSDSNSSGLKSPGMLTKHYAPNTPVRLNAKGPEPSGAYISFGREYEPSEYNLSQSGNLAEAASNLFAMLREIDERNFSSISIAPIPHKGLGLAINDRLQRAENATD